MQLSYFGILVAEWLVYAMVIPNVKKDPTFGDVQRVPTAKVELQRMKTTEYVVRNGQLIRAHRSEHRNYIKFHRWMES